MAATGNVAKIACRFTEPLRTDRFIINRVRAGCQALLNYSVR
jgi:hypothetical protein